MPLQTIKKQTWGLSQNLSLSLEYGTIDKFNVQVPWLQLHTGQVNVLVDTVVLMFRLNTLDHEKDAAKGNESFTQELKMDLLRKEELRMADDTGRMDQAVFGGQSWMARSFNSFLGSVIAKIASKFTLTATKYVPMSMILLAFLRCWAAALFSIAVWLSTVL